MYRDPCADVPDDDEYITDPYGGPDGEDELFTDVPEGGEEPEDLLYESDDSD